MPSISFNNIPFDPQNLSDIECNVALGRLMTAFSQAESLWGFLFRELRGRLLDKISEEFDNMPMEKKISQLRNVVISTLDGVKKASAERYLDEFIALSGHRNKCAHAGWGLLDSEKALFWNGLTPEKMDELCRETEQGREYRTKYVHTISDLNEVTDQIIVLRDAVHALQTEIFHIRHETYLSTLYQSINRKRAEIGMGPVPRPDGRMN